jgi:hypothetical protein
MLTLIEPEFPRIEFVGNSYSCIETGAFEGPGCQVSPTTLTLRSVLPFESVRSLLPSLGIATTCNVGRILMHSAA